MDDLGLDKKIKWQSWFLFYALWSLVVILGFVIFFAARAAFRMLLFDFALREWISLAVANLIEKVLVVIIGVVVLGFIVFVQDYFYKALSKNLLLNRFTRVLGIGLLVLFVFNAMLVIWASFSFAGMILVGLELVAGLIFLIFSFRFRDRKAF
jgi:hypothetical protein